MSARTVDIASMPLIRYRMETWPRGSPGPASAAAASPGVDAYDWVRRYQVREEPGDGLRFLLSVRGEPSESQRTRLTESVNAAVGGDFRVTFEYVDDIPPAPSGKLQYVVPLPCQTVEVSSR